MSEQDADIWWAVAIIFQFGVIVGLGLAISTVFVLNMMNKRKHWRG